MLNKMHKEGGEWGVNRGPVANFCLVAPERDNLVMVLSTESLDDSVWFDLHVFC